MARAGMRSLSRRPGEMGCMKRMMLVFGVLAAVFACKAAFGDEAFERALSLAAEKRYPEAREALDSLLERTPDSPRVRVLHGILLVHEGRTGEAIDTFEALRRDHPDMTEPYNNLAVLHAQEGRLEDARTLLLEALERRPDAVAWANLGDVYERLARRAWERAHALEAGTGDSAERDAGADARPETPGGSAQSSPQVEEAGTWQHGTEPPAAVPGSLVPAAPRRNGVTGSHDGAAGSSAPDAFCAHAGGFPERRLVADAAKWLQSSGVEVREVRRAEHRDPISHKVYLPPFESRRQAAAKLGEIQGRGVRDVAIISDGGLANGISFGVYRDADNMNRRIAAMERLGYPVWSQVAEVRVVSEYTLRIRATGTPAALDAAWKSRYPRQPLRVVGCD